MNTQEQIKVIKKYINYLSVNKDKWIACGKVSELDVNYDIDCLKYALNSLAELDEFKQSIITLNERNLK